MCFSAFLRSYLQLLRHVSAKHPVTNLSPCYHSYMASRFASALVKRLSVKKGNVLFLWLRILLQLPLDRGEVKLQWQTKQVQATRATVRKNISVLFWLMQTTIVCT